MEAIERAIVHGALAGKLRAYVRENGEKLRGLDRLADAHSERATALLDEVGEPPQIRSDGPPHIHQPWRGASR